MNKNWSVSDWLEFYDQEIDRLLEISMNSRYSKKQKEEASQAFDRLSALVTKNVSRLLDEEEVRLATKDNRNWYDKVRDHPMYPIWSLATNVLLAHRAGDFVFKRE